MKDNYNIVLLSHNACGTGWLRSICRTLVRRGVITLDVIGGQPETTIPAGSPAYSTLLDVNASIRAQARLHPDSARNIHFVCDPREAFVKTYFSIRAAKGTTNPTLADFRARAEVLSVEEGMIELIEIFGMGLQLNGWSEEMWRRTQIVRLEDLRSTFTQTFSTLFAAAGAALPDTLIETLESEVGPASKAAQDGAAENWQTYFTDPVSKAFYARYGQLGPRLGYWAKPSGVAVEAETGGASDLRVLILGGSNSVMDPGYMPAFEEQLQTVRKVSVSNLAVGANSCLTGLEKAKTTDPSAFDVVVIEYFINDFPLYYQQGEAFWLATYEGLLRYLLSKNPTLQVVSLLLGRRDEKFYAVQDGMRAHLNTMAERYGINILDFDELAKSKHSDAMFTKLYSDGLHYARPSTTEWVGAELAKRVATLSQQTPQPRIISTIPPLSPHPFTAAQSVRFDAVAPPEFERRDLSNSRYQTQVVHLPQDSQMTLQPNGPLLSISYASTPDTGQLVMTTGTRPPEILYTLHREVETGQFRMLLKTTCVTGEPLSETEISSPAPLRLSVEKTVAPRNGVKVFKDSQMIANQAPGKKAVYLESWLEYRPESELRILVLGASNEIMRGGWLSDLSAYWIENLSIGASSSTAGIFSYAKKAAGNAKVAILSYELNEDTIRHRGLLTEAEIRNNWIWLTSQLRRNGTEPVILILPRAKDGSLVTTITRDLQRALAMQLQIPLIDLSEMFLEAVQRGCPTKALMQDNSHMTPSAARVVGDVARRCLDVLHASPKAPVIPPQPAVDFRVVWMNDHSQGHKVITRGTSLTTATLLQLTKGQSVTVPCPPGSEIVALVVNRLAPGGNVRIGDVRKRVAFCKTPDDVGKFMSVVVDFKGGAVIPKDSFTLTVGDDGPVTEPTHMSKPIAQGHAPLVEIEAVILKIPQGQPDLTPAQRHVLPDLDLVKLVTTDADLAKLAT